MAIPSFTFSSEQSQGRVFTQRLGVVCLFVLSVFVIDRALAGALGHVVAHNHSRFARLYAGQEPPSILILGNSRGADSFLAKDIARASGQPALNLSWMGVSMRLSQVLLEDYLRLNAPPRLVLLEVTSLETPPNQQLGYLMPYTSRGFGLQRYWCEQQAAECWASRVASSYRYNALSTVHAFLHLERDDQSRSHEGVISPALIEDAGTAASQNASYDLLPENALALRSIVEACRQRGIPIRLVVAPFFPAYLRGHRLDDWKQRVREIADEPLWDYSELLSEPRFFADRIHLNGDGSRALLERMLRDRLFEH
jgi:hypothetical protein